MNIALRKNTIPRINRKAAKHVVKKINTVFGEDVEYLIKTCKKCHGEFSVHNFYVKKHKQDKREEDLGVNDFRNICISCHDSEAAINTKNRKQMNRKVRDAILSDPDRDAILRNSMRVAEIYKKTYEETFPPEKNKSIIDFFALEDTNG